jgi:ATP-binding protein involved in chromosome partitioning
LIFGFDSCKLCVCLRKKLRTFMPLQMFQPRERKPLTKIAYTVAIAAGKGGVGKSTVSVNLALALREAGYAVGIMDMDVYGPSVRCMLPEDEMPVQKGDKIIPAVCKGIRMISMAYFRKKHEAAAVRAPIANGLVHQFIHQIEWGPLDFLLIDFPPGTGDIQLTLSQQADLCGAVMVTTPQEVSVMDVRRAVDLFEHMNVPIVGVVENMSFYQAPGTDEKVFLFGKGGGGRLAHEIGVPFLGGVPIDAAVCRCCDEGSSLFETDTASPARDALRGIAEAFIAHVTALKRASGDCMGAFELTWKDMK